MPKWYRNHFYLGQATAESATHSQSGETDSFEGLVDELAIFSQELESDARELLFLNGGGLWYDPVTAMWEIPSQQDAYVLEQSEGLQGAKGALMLLTAAEMALMASEPTEVLAQYFWGARPGHRDELICRDGSPDGSIALSVRYYCLMDYYDPTSVVSLKFLT